MRDVNSDLLVPEFLRETRFAHLEGVLDQPPSWLQRKLITLLSAKVRIDDAVVRRVRNLAGSGPLIYAMKYRNAFDLHFLRIRFAELGLPLPAFVFESSRWETGSLSKFLRVWHARLSGLWRSHKLPASLDESLLLEILQRGGAGVMFLVDEKTSRKRYVHPESDPIRILLDLQGRLPGAVTVLPMMILCDRTSRRVIRPIWESFLGDPDRPGPIKRLLTAIRQWTVPELLVGEPVYLIGQFEEFGADTPWEDLPFQVRKDLIASINARIRVNRGPERLSRTEIKERVLQDPRVLKAVQENGSGEKIPEEKLRKKAESYVDEIAADQHTQVHHFLYYVLKWLFSRVFAGIDLKESQFSRLKAKNAEGSLILVACHKSHFDYLLTGFFCFINQMAIPVMAAGKNLSFWPIGPILRNAGAFFIRRSFKGLGLYTHVFAAYVKVLVKEKYNITFYIEGGRSRTGKFLQPKVGMLSFLLQAVEEEAVPDLAFVPMFVGYDRVPEENSYLRELAGKEKRKETFLAFIRARKILAQSFGRVYVRFHEPISFRTFRDNWRREADSLAGSARENRELVQDFANHIMRGIVSAGVVTPVDLVAAGLVCTGATRVTRSQLFDSIDYFSRVLRAEQIEFSESLDDSDRALETALGMFNARGFVRLEHAEDPKAQATYAINEQSRVNLEFYKNALVNYLWPASLCATVIIKQGRSCAEVTQEMHEDFNFLTRLFLKELIFDPLTPQETLLERSLSIFRQNGWIGEPDSDGSAILCREPLECLRGILGDLMEIYYLVLASAQDKGSGQKDLIKTMVRVASHLRNTGAGGTVSLPLVAVRNALSRLAEMGILDYSPSKKSLKGVNDPEQLDRAREFLAQSLRGRINDPGAVV
jgi:glycerol-3-phosphate O-acyltransferase